MIEELKNLIELQHIDSEIVKKTDLIKTLPQKKSIFEQPLKEARTSYEKAKEKYNVIEKKKKEKERLLDDLNEKIKRLKARTSEIKTNKEYQAHLKEIETVEKEVYSVEDDILILMEQIEVAHRELKMQEEKVKKEDARVRELEKRLMDETEEAEREIESLKGQRTEIVKKITPESYRLYMTLLETKRGLAVTEAVNEICLGCNMNISPQMYVELKRNDRIYQCPQCHRILYWKGSQ